MIELIQDNLLLVISILAGFIVLFLGIFVYSSNRSKMVNKTFLALCGSVVLWICAVIIASLSQDSTVILLSTRLALAFAVLLAFFLLCFTYYFPRKNLYKFPFLALCVVAIITFVITLTPYTVSSIEIVGELQSLARGWGYYIFILYFTFCIGGSVYNLLVKRKEVGATGVLQIKYILTGFFISVVLGFITNALIPLLTGITATVQFGPLAVIPFIFLTSVAILKHHLFKIKVIATELSVFALWVFTLIRTLLSDTVSEAIGNGVFLLITVIIGIFLIRSVIREVKNREETEGLNEALIERKNKLERLTHKLKEANHHLKELMNIKTEFLQIASHQLRTPLTSLRGFLSMQAEGDLDKLPEKERKGLHQDMVTVANNLNNIVNDLLHATELEGGNINFDIEKVQVQDLIEEAITTFKSTYKKKELFLKFERNNSLPEIEADAGYLRQVFFNIINNAEKYTEEGGLTITTIKKDENIEIVFSDTGNGIDPEDRDKLFGKFVRGKKAALMHTDGSGLGLYIIKKIVDEHHGEVSLESEGVGKGTTVRVTLPIRQS